MSRDERFVCDEMLKGLGRWLRAAGYDTLCLADGEEDTVLLQRAREEGRWLLTRDRPLCQRKEAQGITLLLECNGLDECAGELTRRLHIDWQWRPFSRCLLCNTPLLEATAQQRLTIPADARHDPRVLYCPQCEQLYWEGGHVRRMRRHLQRWAAGDFLPHADAS